jgi:hypothetical protein
MAAGSAYQAAAANAWSAGNFYAVAPQVNGVAATTDVFRIAGVIVLPGLEAPSAARAPLIMRPFDQELLTCQRHYEKSFDYAMPPANGPTATALATTAGQTCIMSSNDSTGSFLSFKVRKRAAPTLYKVGNNAGFWGYYPTPSATPAWNTNAWGGGSCEIGVLGSQQVVSNAYITSFGHWVADARL